MLRWNDKHGIWTWFESAQVKFLIKNHILKNGLLFHF